MSPLQLEPTFFCRACDALASPRTCAHGRESRARAVRHQRPRDPARRRPPARAVHAARGGARSWRAHYGGAPVPPPVRPRQAGGFIVWFTGLSGAGKTTLAEGAAPELGR